MHEGLEGSGNVAVIDEEIFFDVERRVAAFEITGAIVIDAVTEDQILCPCGSANRIGLHKAHALQGAIECCWLREVASDGESSQVVDRDRHWTRITGFFAFFRLTDTWC